MSSNTSGSCGCYEKTKKQTPANLSNPPGLSTLKYRVGTHSQFKADMLTIISRKPALKNLTTRENNDLSIALLDSWATIADVLSFYQERIINEGYLRTATERRSVLELARTLGYELKPGVAASAHLVFMVENVMGSPLQSRVDEGTTVMSVPGQDEKLQIFETIETIEAKTDLNDLRPLQFTPQKMTIGLTELYLKGVDTNLVPGDAILIVGQDRASLVNSERWDFRFIQTVTAYPDKKYTHITWKKPLGYVNGDYKIHPEENATVFALRQRASFFGYNAPDWKAMPNTIKKAYHPDGKYDDESNRSNPAEASGLDDWPGFDLFSSAKGASGPGSIPVHLDAVYPKILPQSWIVFAGQRAKNNKIDYYVELCKVTNVEVAAQTDFTLSAKTTKVVLDVNELYLAGFMRRDTVIYCVSEPLEIADKPKTKPVSGSKIILDRKVPELMRGQKIIVQGKLAKIVAKEKSIDTFTDNLDKSLFNSTDADVLQISARVQVSTTDGVAEVFYRFSNRGGASILLAVKPVALNPQTYGTNSNSKPEIDSSTSKSWRLLNPRPIVEASGLLRWYVTLEGIDDADEVYEGYVVDEIDQAALSLEDQDNLIVSEIVSIKDLFDVNGTTKVILDIPAGRLCALSNVYDLASVHIYANVALATHGETVHETLGSGDSFDINQQFYLKKLPLTYISAATPSGAKSTLKVYINDVQWQEVPSICYLNSHNLGYSVRIEDNGDTSVSFGDGLTGARLPSGVENITASYRSGIGLQGGVAANKLTLMPKKPFGIRSVTNPIAASGAAAPEKMEDAKINAPSAVLTLSRIVSLKDYENFARTFLGIAKAKADVELNAGNYIVRLIVAPEDAKPLAITSMLYTNLKAAIAGVCAYGQKVCLESFMPVYFNVTGVLDVDPSYRPEDVQTNVKIALIKTFSFEQRTFKQPVSLEEILSVIIAVPGVIYIDNVTVHLRDLELVSVFNLNLTDTMLLMINPEGITLEVKA
ncbi:MAG: hypothetical protein LBH74_01295 [Nitrososphaerota archaeon]|jgi:hypothetical protein|nr:hypothetical protein [Nitrososphaerota archaeon]